MLDGKPLPSIAWVRVWEKGEGDVHTFEDGTDESLGRWLQRHTIAVIPNSLFFLQSYVSLFYPIHVYLHICIYCC